MVFICYLSLSVEVKESPTGITGAWHALHIVEVIPDEMKKVAEYRLTTSILLFLTVKNAAIGQARQNGTLTRQVVILVQHSPLEIGFHALQE